MEVVVLALAALLAFANGANDNSKGVATLVGYGAGVARSARGVHWPVVRDVVLSWVVTIPTAAAVAAGTRLILATVR